MIRIVKMKFRPEEIEKFKSIFRSKKGFIAAMPGCRGVELLQDIHDPCLFMTYSIWDGPEFLENYRQSDLFNEVWAQTKVLFVEKPNAWSLVQIGV